MTNSFPILIAEDNPVSRRLLETGLIKFGYEVVSANDGREAFKILKKNFFPMVITDWMMPEMDGLELCRAIRSNNFPGYVFIVLVTAKDSQDDIITGLEAGADDYITKPFNQAELMARLKAGKRVLELERSLKEANDKIKILSITDPLTGIYNRGYLTEHLPREISRAKRYGHPLSLIMSDIDLFKKINDSYGHQAGDKLLKDFVDCLRGAIRNRIDWMVRYGGEEFLIVLPETNIEGACQVAERFRTLLSESVFTIKDNEIKITASFGVSGFDPSKQKEKISVEFLIGLADKYLYQAKKRGRNRVEALKIDD
ncbi:MAG: diguanylate cyclase response regulator [Desulfuromonadales bacterium C00003093]|nr:MAG: diguanylate cyclase response regulator [Desulfuromonadales bacterium C00003093]